MDLIDSKYINLVSSRLQKFNRIKKDLYNFRCPICGDSKKNKNRARGYFYSIKNNTNFKCHNCGSSLSFGNFLKDLDPILHKQYSLEKFKEGFTGKNFTVKEPEFKFNKPKFKQKLDLPKASKFSIAKRYLESRQLNPNSFYFAENFKEWTNTKKHTFDFIGEDESRIIIPMYDQNSELIGYQGRALEKNPAKYITVMLSEDYPKIYGLDKLDTSKLIYIVEGPFDSMFVDNCVAMCGSDLDISSFMWEDYVFVFDNEPRNKEIVNKISKNIDLGNKVVIWPTNIIEKDINDMVIAGLNVMDVLKSNIYSGLEAKIKFNNWKKI